MVPRIRLSRGGDTETKSSNSKALAQSSFSFLTQSIPERLDMSGQLQPVGY